MMTFDTTVDLLRALIRLPSFSTSEAATADCLAAHCARPGIRQERIGNNLLLYPDNWRSGLPVCLLNSHHDTVRPAAGYTRDPFAPTVENDKLYGLGSNDAGGCLVSLLHVFLTLAKATTLPVNLLFVASAEEEISGPGGLRAVLPELPPVDFAIVGEPTQLRMAVAERGLLVIDATVHGRSGHAARDEGENALYKALEDIQRLRAHRFGPVSPQLGACRATVTQIAAGTQHNVVPDRCTYVIDVRTNDRYSNPAILEELRGVLQATLQPRSLHLNSSHIAPDHPLVRAGKALGLSTYGSPTLSDMALLPMPAIKLGPGKSARSHTADEYIRLSELRAGIACYEKLIRHLSFPIA